FHQVKHRADDGGIVAEQVRPGRERKDRTERRQPAILARHVVCLRRHWSKRRTPQDELRAAKANQIREVGGGAWKLRHLHLPREIESLDLSRLEMPAQICGERRPIELLRRPDIPRISVHGRLDYHFAPCCSRRRRARHRWPPSCRRSWTTISIRTSRCSASRLPTVIAASPFRSLN